ncbi:glycoside hydrolase family 25 protein [Novosphingobium capsulatum]|uniref:glycoside hydrolase family 25 protein n=1 Tax=Novosphingobium capsulatum TaxID=13688 RepID=UPI002E0D6C1B|nr:glycoside hydrolase family 25 protein [Novosphingobium capsulatum]
MNVTGRGRAGAALAAIAAALGGLFASNAMADSPGTRVSATDCSVAVNAAVTNSTINLSCLRGLTSTQLARLIGAINNGNEASRAELQRKSEELGVTRALLAAILSKLGGGEVPESALPARVAAAIVEIDALQAKARPAPGDTPAVAVLKQEAQASIAAGQIDAANISLMQISVDYLKNLPGAGYSTGVALSHHNRNVDFTALKGRGFSFAYLKASQGVWMIDQTAAGYAAAARAAGMQVGLYHFFDPKADPEQQAASFVRIARSLGATLPPLADFEPAGIQSVIDPGYADRAIIFLSAIKRDLGTTPFVYTYRAFADQHLDERFGSFPLFLGDFSASARGGHPKLPKWWNQLSFWDLAGGVQNDTAIPDVEIVAYKGQIARAEFR